MTGNTKDKIISELDKIQQEVREHTEDSRDLLEGMDRDVRRFESMLRMEMGDCKRSGDALEKRLSKLEGVCGRLDGVSESILKIREGTYPIDGAFCMVQTIKISFLYIKSLIMVAKKHVQLIDFGYLSETTFKNSTRKVIVKEY